MAQAAVLLATAAYTGYAQNEAGKAQKDIANRNASLMEAAADDAIERGNEEALAVRRRTRGIVGKQRAAFAGQGIDISTGTAMDLQEETSALGELDEATVRKNAFREAWGLRGQASNDRQAGAYARRAGTNQAIGTVLGGVGDAYPSASTWWNSRGVTVAGTGK